MKSLFFRSFAIVVIMVATLASCSEFDYEDVGAIQYEEKQYSLTDFDRVEMGDAFIVQIEYGNYFSITARGDRRNISDLVVKKSGNTLIVRYDEPGNRKHETYIDIVMPSIVSADMSGATNSVITGFQSLASFSVFLSGASVAQIDVTTSNFDLNLSGASVMDLRGATESLAAEISGASSLKAFNFQAANANLNVSGSSAGKIKVSSQLKAIVTGASSVVYRGNPTVESDVSGASSVIKDLE
jgi:hypothetical protein